MEINPQKEQLITYTLGCKQQMLMDLEFAFKSGVTGLPITGFVPKNSTRSDKMFFDEMGFEPTRGGPIGLAVQRLNHSATSSYITLPVKLNLLIL